MKWPKSVGKNPSQYVADEVSHLVRAVFECKVREFVGPMLAEELRPDDFQVLFEISDEHCRIYSAICVMENRKLKEDWKSRKKLMTATETRLILLQNNLKMLILSPTRPVTALLAKSISEKLSNLQSELINEFGLIKTHQRLSQGMLRAMGLQTWRNDYVAHLTSYIEDIPFVSSTVKQKSAKIDKLTAGVMLAARVFSETEIKDDILERIPMARSRAKAHIKREILDYDDFPVFQTKPKKKTTP